jgi:transaldolase
MRDVFDRSGGQDGRVSIEVDPRLAGSTAGTIEEAKAQWWAVDRPNLLVKIPATPEGLPAITAALAAGISVNVTLIFSLDRYREVIDAYLTGMEQATASGRDLSTMASVASFFVSRVDTEIDNRLEKIGTDDATALLGQAALANARLAYEQFEESLRSPRWQSLSAAGARPQRPLWASTGVKNPAYDDTRYVVGLVAPRVVNTMPEATLLAVADHGKVRGDSIQGSYAEARRILDRLAAVGVDYDDVVLTLERKGVQKFTDSWNQLLQTVDEAMSRA